MHKALGIIQHVRTQSLLFSVSHSLSSFLLPPMYLCLDAPSCLFQLRSRPVPRPDGSTRMNSRIPLPVRLVQSGVWAPTASGRSSAGCRVLTAYKPSGLPCYAASQVNAVAASGGDGRRLCAIHTRHTSTASSTVTAIEAGPQPNPEDPSDSLLTRLVDAALPGCAPYVALPVVSSLLRRGGQDTVSAAQLNQWTIRHKGLVLVTWTPSDALFLRNAAQLGLVQQTYRVVCRLPPGVAAAARRYLRACQNCQQSRHASDGGSKAKRTLNPYLQAHMERRHQQHQLADLRVGIPLFSESPSVTRNAGCPAVSTLPSDAQMPASVHPHPLVNGGFFDVARGQLRVQGTVSCYIRPQLPLTASSAARIHQRSRLQSLFSSPDVATLGDVSGAIRSDGCLHDSQHPWMRPGWRLGVSLDVPYMQCSVAAAAGGHHADDPRCASVPAPRGKSLSMGFRLVSLSPHDDSDIALYEVHTHGDITADEVAAVFQAEGLRVVNDYGQDVSLAMAVEEVATRMRAAPPGLLHDLPLGLQHRLRSATAEELVALPLMRMPLEDADLLAAQHTLLQLSSLSPSLPFADDVERLQQMVRRATSSASGSASHPLQRLLLNALSSMKLTNEEERCTYERVLALALGNGVECAGVVFPDPSDTGNVHALQQLWLTFEQQRQRQPSLADAARAAQQHPLASSLRYITRSVLDDPAGLTRVPLLQDLAMSFPPGIVAQRPGAQECNGDAPSGRGECSFTQAAQLLGQLSHSQNVQGGHSLCGDEDQETACVPARVNDAKPLWLQTEVPPPYEGTFQEWCAASLAPSCCKDTASRYGGPAVLLPSPESLLGRCHVPGTSKECGTHLAGESPRSGDEVSPAVEPLRGTLPEHVRLPVRLFLRAEELAELRCTYCGGVGHIWQLCAARVTENVAVLEDDGLVTKSLPLSDNNASTAVASHVSQPTPAPLETSVMYSEGITSTDDAAAALAEKASTLTRHHQQQQQHLVTIGYGSDASVSLSASSAVFAVDVPLISVPNVAATHRFKADHALRSESRKPAVHRRVMRCVYCGGRHHVTACPTLRAQDDESEARHGDAAAVGSQGKTFSPSSSSQSGSSLFCIKCGQHGHLYTRCRQVPVGLHHATHCPICLQPRTSASHDPAHCPRRAPVPDGYQLNGIPVADEGSAQHKGSHWPSSSHREAHSEEGAHPGATDGQPRRRGADLVRAPRRRRRRGSVLIADSFVDVM
ncbi:hypothetical protein, conserved [Leishmania tarentolae]|uniref:CCHC-type domain-containing protein n=1 Tax=Leishmania tarentolae TaxID=5689 RepID=A0A640KSM6_LEITA|nr:hypothetical protein, conserved [Leishmania tarentolae]